MEQCIICKHEMKSGKSNGYSIHKNCFVLFSLIELPKLKTGEKGKGTCCFKSDGGK